MGALAGGGSVAVAVGVGFICHASCVTCQVSVLLSVHVKRFSVSHMRDFLPWP